ncbi:MAG: right-handed parallel beta-helix repeat-containing protein [Candidatus Eisenbacteria bacterium]
MLRSILAVSLLCVVLVSSAPAAIVVNQGGGDDYLTIQEGVTAAAEGETVLVMQGTYTGAGNRNLDFGTKNIVLRSDAGAELTTIDLENVLGNRAFQFISSGQDTSCVIDGFTVTNCLTDETHGGSGAAVYMTFASPKFINMIFSNCDSTDRPGGGIYMLSVSSPVLRHVRFENCHAAGNWGGGAIRCESAYAPSFYDVIFENNSVDSGGFGGAINMTSTTAASFRRVTFTGNTATNGAGALNLYNSGATLTLVTFARNHSGVGGALFCYNSSPYIIASTFFANSADGNGGALYCQNSTPVIRQCVFSHTGWSALGGSMGPPASDRGLAVYCDATSYIDLLQVCSYGNEGGDGLCGSEPGGGHVISEHPRYCDMLTDDLTLAGDSPCLPAGNPWSATLGAWGEGCSNPAVEATSWGRIKALHR